jgi:Gamma-glutamyl cyclotransferase, AIG2-like
MALSGDHVFGYASLTTDMHRAGEELCRLHGYRRAWNVATDNSLTFDRYKIYLDPVSGEQPAVFVTFLNLVPDPACSVGGVLFPVSAAALEVLDRRERNYERREVSGAVGEQVEGRVWCYFGTSEAQARYRTGFAAGAAVISREYRDRVLGGFAACGAEALADFEATTEPAPCPVIELERVDLE